MLVALYRSNPDAFIRKNLNLVRTGKVLRVPDREEVAAVARGDAAKEYRTHVADWNSYRQKVADVAGAAPADKPRAAVSGKITTRVEDKGAKGEPKDVVRLSKGETPGDAGKKAKPRSSTERIRSLEEEAVAREKALTEANERIAQLEKTLKDMQKLVELKSPGLAAAQQQAQQAAAAKPDAKAAAKPDAKAAAKPEAKKPEAVAVAKPEPAKPEAKKPEVVAAAKPEVAKPVEAPKPEPAKPEAVAPAEKPAADKAEAPKPEAKPAAKTPAPAPKPKAKAKEPELMDQVMDALTDPLYLGVGGGVIVIGGLALWLSRRRRSKDHAGGEPVAPRLSKAAAAAAGAAALSADSSAASQPAAAPAGDEVDPLAEAEVYIAYGRDGQAEEILKDALSKNPKREDVQLKLLEIYAARKDKSAFGKIAGEFNKQTGGSGDSWIKAAAMGYALDPANSLYAAGKGVVGMAAPSTGGATDVDLDLGTGDTGTATDITLDAGTAAAAGTDTGILDLGGDEKAPAPAMPDFSLEVPAAEDKTAAVAPAPESNMIDFQIELPKSSEDEPTRAQSAAAAAPSGDGGLDFKLDGLDLTMDAKVAPEAAGGGGEKDGHWYDVQTKFDLAKAYQEMGDKDGAKEILQEVIKEGDAEQKTQAKTLLDSLG
jgi:pilus assembly protein FimV